MTSRPSSRADSAPSAELLALRLRVEALLGEAVREFKTVSGRYEVPYQSTRIVVQPLDWTKGRTLLRVVAPIATAVPESPELYRRLSELNNTIVLGKFYFDDGTILVEHNLLGESVDRSQFRAALTSVAHHADHLADLLLADFGGRKWGEGS